LFCDCELTVTNKFARIFTTKERVVELNLKASLGKEAYVEDELRMISKEESCEKEEADAVCAYIEQAQILNFLGYPWSISWSQN
jgi:hypothetical protein